MAQVLAFITPSLFCFQFLNLNTRKKNPSNGRCLKNAKGLKKEEEEEEEKKKKKEEEEDEEDEEDEEEKEETAANNWEISV